MKTRILKSDQELTSYKQQYDQHGHSVDLDYLRQAKVRAFFDTNGEMIAGYVLNRRRPLRTELLIPDAIHAAVPELAPDRRICELTSNWISERPGSFFSERLYLRAIIEVLASGVQFVIIGTAEPKVYGIHAQIFPRQLYHGEMKFFGKPEVCWIYGASRSVLLKKMITTVPNTFITKLLQRPSYRERASAIAEAADSERQSSGHKTRSTDSAS